MIYLHEDRICPICRNGVCEKGQYLCQICQEIQDEKEYEIEYKINMDMYYSQFDDQEESEYENKTV